MELINDFTKPYIFLSGEGMLVEGTARILLWEHDCIILQAREKIKITGDTLSLDFKGQGNVMISGKIFSVEFFPC